MSLFDLRVSTMLLASLLAVFVSCSVACDPPTAPKLVPCPPEVVHDFPGLPDFPVLECEQAPFK